MWTQLFRQEKLLFLELREFTAIVKMIEGCEDEDEDEDGCIAFSLRATSGGFTDTVFRNERSHSGVAAATRIQRVMAESTMRIPSGFFTSVASLRRPAFVQNDSPPHLK